jgi:hypothetical protein
VRSFGNGGTSAHAVLVVGSGELSEALAFGLATDTSDAPSVDSRDVDAASWALLAKGSQMDILRWTNANMSSPLFPPISVCARA